MTRVFEVKDFTPLEDGKHKGRIMRIEYRDDPYQYVDIVILVEGGNGIELKYGCPQNITTSSKFGKLLEAFGKKLVPGERINETDIEKIFVSKMVEFMTITEVVTGKDKQRREFSRIIDGSVKPL